MFLLGCDSPKQAVRKATDGSVSRISPLTPKLKAVFTESVPSCGLQAVSGLGLRF